MLISTGAFALVLIVLTVGTTVLVMKSFHTSESSQDLGGLITPPPPGPGNPESVPPSIPTLPSENGNPTVGEDPKPVSVARTQPKPAAPVKRNPTAQQLVRDPEQK